MDTPVPGGKNVFEGQNSSSASGKRSHLRDATAAP
eukprot:CAMPEP_0203934988 /NCGR_PEP_ID=MMETSP0359-20131031/72837_1 /ASSEMBLY_ACC=CAM_ASM_000338 /TAXON_ID=268821 /ORGANISM="Scrippsiella Hangoei, Strain SHTV-5" /LENGTH=34 /DNA_ID= /DNA_START= /DNA_END= /DNA_ORIENTATION=